MKIPAFFRVGKPKILFVATEAAPFAKIGGLGAVMYSLPKAFVKNGYDCRIFLPKYASLVIKECALKTEVEHLKIAKNDPHGLFVSNILSCAREEEPVVYFLENQEYYEKRANVYGYADDTVRWVLLSRGVLEFIKKSAWKPDVIIAADWQTGFIPNLLATEYKNDPELSKISTIFAIHNLHYQGMFDHHFVSEMDFDAGQAPISDFDDPRINHLNGMRRGIMYADVITTVSPSYAQEILRPGCGECLEELLKERRARFFGILNGIDCDLLNPETDTYIKAKYSKPNFIRAKEKNKLALQKQFGLKEDKEMFVIGIVSRMDSQKGFDLIMEISDQLFQNLDFQLVIVGGGDNKYRLFFQSLEAKYSGRIAGHYFFDPIIPRTIFAGSDAILIPSYFEPCGLVQMEAMRYGAVPIVRATGGLKDTVVDFDPKTEAGNGFVFENFNPFALLVALVRAKETFRNKKEWNSLVSRVMEEDFSWEKSAEEYASLFPLATKFHEEKNNKKI